ncbi:peptidoglycan-binding protein [Streptomyces sp. AD681]|uniref:peptidoglycan-binding domain-containing protein n=1 Tax=Streptomyces sp. AD681 TaxID=3019069 RepID=UPI0022F1ABD8|nr:peptidoglycan-binding protein [Streptomyces sp. AD681]MDA5146514.1 peptidoglycan-binding protein [Streptomyces sp. AD681]
MRALTKALVSATAAVGIAAGGLATAGTATAAPAPVQQSTSAEVAPLAVYNFGLSSAQAKGIQRWLKARWGYTGSIDGQLGVNSWKAFQRELAKNWEYKGKIDGVPGYLTIRALQWKLSMPAYGYDGLLDGIAGPATQAAFKKFGDWAKSTY